MPSPPHDPKPGRPEPATALPTSGSADRGAEHVRDAVRELSQAWRRLLLYPPGHPERSEVTDRVLAAVEAALDHRGELALGVTRDSFVVAEEMHSGLGAEQFANLLYRRNVAVVRFSRGIEAPSIERFMASLRRDPDAAPHQGAETFERLDERRPMVEWPGLRLESADFSSLLATDDLSSRAAPVERLTLWERLLQLQLRDVSYLGDAGLGGTGDLRATLQRILSTLPREMAGGEFRGELPAQVRRIVELIETAVLSHLREAVAARRLIDLEQVDDLLRDLPDAVAVAALEQVVSALADDDDGRLELTALFAAVDSRLALLAVRRLRDRGFRFAEHALSTIVELSERSAAEATSGAAVSADPPAALRACIEDGRDAARLPPTDELVFLYGGCRASDAPWPGALEPLRQTLQPGATQLALLGAITELLDRPHLHQNAAAHLAPRVEQLVGDLIDSGHPMGAVAVIHNLRDLAANHAQRLGRPLAALQERLCGAATAERIRRSLGAGDERRSSQLQTLVSTLGDGMIEELVSGLAAEDDRALRRALFDFLKTFRSQVIPAARKGLEDRRWFVVRNMVALLDEIDDRSSLPHLRRAAQHEDLRVRSTAVRALARMDRAFPEPLIRDLLETPDPAFVERTIGLLGRSRVGAAVAPLCDLLRRRDRLGRNTTLRGRAIEALGQIGDPRALDAIAPMLSALRLQGADERRAAYRSLAGYPIDSVRPLLERGSKARDGEIRDLCARILAAGAAPPGADSGASRAPDSTVGPEGDE
ncbi:MAG: HEAT repeat domain-containing protein [Acidobacteria bacterium]|nr:MAG: HEAT repeat domain-containing protein [Acidobacteriota bacterium]REJ99407.1 MAG: HEAT repeat domain-containing protein [Acidobacteriota bacterium]